jgi:hypothetical protein
MDDNAGTDNSFSRRKMLGRIVAASAVAWTVPVISSVSTPAFAGSPPLGCPTDCSTNVCGVNPPAPCGSNPDTGNCLCAFTVDGRCQCVQPICRDACEGGTSCPPGFVCVPSDCCGYPVCAALCDTPLDASQARLRRWAS